jgi:hypothetical protein
MVHGGTIVFRLKNLKYGWFGGLLNCASALDATEYPPEHESCQWKDFHKLTVAIQ